MGFADRSTTQQTIDVAIIEHNADTLHQVVALAAQSLRLDIQVIKDTSDYFMLYGASEGPDVLLVGLDTNPQKVLAETKAIISQAPLCGVIVYGRAVTMELLQQAMVAGARRYLAYPFDAATLRTTVTEVRAEMRARAEDPDNVIAYAPARQDDAMPAQRRRDPKVVTLFSPKGGVGTSTLVVNIACALKALGRSVVIVDGNISFGNIGVFLNLAPNKSVLQLVGDPNGIQEAGVEEALIEHSSGVKVLLAPPKPEEADTVQGDHLRAIITILKGNYDYVILDTWPSYDERVLAMLEMADQILIPSGPELPSVKNLAAFLRVARLLGYPEDKLIPVLMRANSVPTGHLRDIETFLEIPLTWRVVSDGKRVTESVNNGEPFVLTDPQAPVSQNIYELARMIDGQDVEVEKPAAEREQPFWKRARFGIKAG